MSKEGPYPYASPKMAEMLKRNGIGKVSISAECGDGWLGLIETTIQTLKQSGWDGQIDQIKEKFGGLRFYIGGTWGEYQERQVDFDKLFDIIGAAEGQSYNICESCGSTDEVSTAVTAHGYWVKSWCSKCRDKDAKEYEAEIRKRLKERKSK